jgi:hypothetical protein
VFSTINSFSSGDHVQGGFSLAQSAHTLGSVTGLNELKNKIGKTFDQYVAKMLARKIERFTEKGVEKLLGDIPGVGLAFDIYFIKQYIDELSKLNFNNPNDRKLLPLRDIDLSLDFETTVLNLVQTFCPEAEVVAEPAIIVLSIMRMAIDDFYLDIMGEIDKIKWKNPWSGLKFLGALAKGVLDGVVDFLTGIV